jgi:hypothetical protein
MVTQTRLNVTSYVQCLTCFILLWSNLGIYILKWYPSCCLDFFPIFYWAVGQIISTFQFLLSAFRGKIILFLQLPCQNALFLSGCNMGGLPLYKDKVFTVRVMKIYREEQRYGSIHT